MKGMSHPFPDIIGIEGPIQRIPSERTPSEVTVNIIRVCIKSNPVAARE